MRGYSLCSRLSDLLLFYFLVILAIIALYTIHNQTALDHLLLLSHLPHLRPRLQHDWGNFRVQNSVVQIFISTLLLLDPGLDAFATGYRDRPTAVHDQKAWFAHYWWTISVQSVVLQRAEIESCRG